VRPVLQTTSHYIFSIGAVYAASVNRRRLIVLRYAWAAPTRCPRSPRTLLMLKRPSLSCRPAGSSGVKGQLRRCVGVI
jgi:hypothetical protein